MRDERLCLLIAFCFGLVPTLICPALMPRLHLAFFAPFLILLIYRRPLIHCLWWALACGLILDLLSSHRRLGVQALAYFLTTWLLFRQKNHVFNDKPISLPLMTCLFGITSAIAQMGILQVFERGISPSWQWVGTDLLLWPLADALYAAVWFYIPSLMLQQRQRNS